MAQQAKHPSLQLGASGIAGVPRARPALCSSCARPLTDRWAFEVGGAVRCLRCTLRYGPLLRRSALTALVVGSILTAINQGGALIAGTASLSLLWQIPLTYCVPFCVASWGALTNSRL